MNYSRRQLYELGEPFGESATRLKVGGRIYGGGSSAPSETKQTSVTELPEWARPYAKDILSKGSALTDISQNPYQTYGGARQAGFSPLQTQAMTSAQNMQTPEQGQAGTALSAISGLGGLNVAGQANTQGFQNQVGGYMNPYLQYSLAPQLAEANRQYDISGTKQQSAATQAGAFGGSREAIMAAENERNRNMGLQNIVGQGYNTAFNQAQNQYNQNLGTQLQGFGMANAAAGQLGQLGGQQFQQGMDINKLQAGYGAMQQAQQQQGLDTAYQDFQNQKNYPYRQLGYMSDLLRGTPTGSSGVTNMYQAPPSTAQNLTALGLGAAGASRLMGANGGLMNSYAPGGEVKTYAGDKESVTSSDNVEEIISTLNPQQLQAALKNAQARGDDRTVAAIMERLDSLSREASMDKGIAGAMPQQMADGVVNAAGGGILAFAKAGAISDPDAPTVEDSNSEGIDIASLLGNQRVIDPALQKKVGERVYGLSEALIDRKGYNPKPEDRGIYEKAYVTSMLKDAGPDPYTPYGTYLDQKAAKQGQTRSRAEGAALLKAIPLVLQGSNAMRGIGAGAGSLGASMGDIEQAQQVAEDHMARARIGLASMQRNEKMGLRKEARADYSSIQANLIAADKNDILGKTNAANVLNNLLKSNIVRTGAGAGSGPKPPKLAERLYDDNIANLLATEKPKQGETDVQFKARINATAGELTAKQIKDLGPVKAEQANTAQVDKRTAAEAAAWSQTYKGRQAQKSYAIANGIKTGTANPSWREEAREHHRKNFGKTAPAGGSTVINFDSSGQPIQ